MMNSLPKNHKESREFFSEAHRWNPLWDFWKSPEISDYTD